MSTAKNATKAAEKEAQTLNDPENQAQELVQAGVQPSGNSAAALAAQNAETPEHDHEGGYGAEEIKDTGIKPGKPIGAQLQPAVMTPQGSLEHNTVPSPSGPMPASTAIHSTDPKEVEKLEAQVAAQQARAGQVQRRVGRTGRYRISEDLAHQIGSQGLRAVAFDRGYELSEGGKRATVQNFLRAQDEDEYLEDPPKGWNPFAQDAATIVPTHMGVTQTPSAADKKD